MAFNPEDLATLTGLVDKEKDAVAGQSPIDHAKLAHLYKLTEKLAPPKTREKKAAPPAAAAKPQKQTPPA